MKSLNEIKKSLKQCANGSNANAYKCQGCPYEFSVDCLQEQNSDILEMIRWCETVEDERSLACARESVAFAEGQKQILDTILSHIEKAPKWISVQERPPENDEPVLVSAEKQGLNGKVYNVVFTAFHTDGTTHTEESGYTWDNRDDLGFKYCEDTDDYLIPEAWWEDVRYGEEYAMIPDYVNITHWMPLPESHKKESPEK